jgi:1-deoxy-D-xylulose-5-phosphate synthase
VAGGPTALRFPRGNAPDDIPAVAQLGSMDVLRAAPGDARDVLLVGVGAMAGTCTQVADRLADQGIGVTVVDPRWVQPLDPALAAEAARWKLVVTVEDSGERGGAGDAVARLLRDHDVTTPVRTFGIAQQFLHHGERAELLDELGLTPQQLARVITETVARRTPELEPERQS